MNVINRVETMGGPNVYKGAGRRIDLPRAAERQAKDLDSHEPADSKLNIKIKVLLIGMTGGLCLRVYVCVCISVYTLYVCVHVCIQLVLRVCLCLCLCVCVACVCPSTLSTSLSLRRFL
jgi:hypothetical protein